MSEKTYWLCLWTIIACAFCFIIYTIAEAGKENNRRYYDTVSKCIEHGGLWNWQNYQCIRNK